MLFPVKSASSQVVSYCRILMFMRMIVSLVVYKYGNNYTKCFRLGKERNFLQQGKVDLHTQILRKSILECNMNISIAKQLSTALRNQNKMYYSNLNYLQTFMSNFLMI